MTCQLRATVFSLFLLLAVHEAITGERLIDVINRAGINISQVCYHPQLGPIQTCDTCMVETNGQLVRACATTISAVMEIFTNNGNCTIHNTEKLLGIEHPKRTCPPQMK